MSGPAPGSRLQHARALLAFYRDPVLALRALRRRYGATFAFRAPGRSGRLYVVTSDPVHVRELAASTAFRSSGLTFGGPSGSAHRRIRSGLFRMHGQEHLRMRKVIGPALGRGALEEQRETLGATILGLLDTWRAGETRDLAREMKDLARHVAAPLLFSRADFAQADRLGARIEQWFGSSFAKATRLLPFDLPGLPYREMVRRAESVEDALLALIRSCQREGAQGSDLLSQLVRARDQGLGLSDAELVGQLAVLFLAAHETTAHALSWTLFLLAQHPRVAERLADEVAALGSGVPALERLERLALLDAVVRESLRLFTVVPWGMRVAVEPAKLGGYALTSGSRVVICHDVMHRVPEFFPEPDRFLPERWADGEPPPYAYVPFSAGPHRCIGRALAVTTLKLTLALVLQRFSWSLVPGARIDRHMTVALSPRPGLPVRLRPAGTGFERVAVRGSALDLVELPND